MIIIDNLLFIKIFKIVVAKNMIFIYKIMSNTLSYGLFNRDLSMKHDFIPILWEKQVIS